jgi:hypothetical protein
MAEMRSLGLRDFPPEVLTRVLLAFLADNAAEARLRNGARLCDLSDVIAWLRELRQEIKVEPASVGGLLAKLNTTCHDCGHVHEGSDECGVFIGGGPDSKKFCRCEKRVLVC